MDWRVRDYFLVRLNSSFDKYGMYYENRLREIKENIPSIKVISPYKHFKDNQGRRYDCGCYCDGYDGTMPGFAKVQLLISCKKKDSLAFTRMFKQFQKNDRFIYAKKLTQALCGQ